MKNWSDSLADLQRSAQPHVLVTVIGTAGSTPRAAGSKILVTADDAIDSIGGGQLEFKAIAYARELLLQNTAIQELKYFPLGASTAQCCGGQATLLFECFPAREAELLLFGAGHVAKALVTLLQELPVQTHWIDNRPGFLPTQSAANIKTSQLDDPVDAFSSAAAGSHVLIMTHDHQLDFELAEAALKADSFSSVGVIGSNTKAARFRHRLQMRGVTDAQLERFSCPVGIAEVSGKRPMEVAVSMAGELIAAYQQKIQQQPSYQHLSQQEHAKSRQQGVSIKDMQRLLGEKAASLTTKAKAPTE